MTDVQPPAAAAAKFQEGWAAHQRGAIGAAWGAYQQVLEMQPRHFDALHLMGLIAAQAKLFDQAVGLIGQALAVDPANAAAHFNLGKVHEDLKQSEAALASYDKAIHFAPGDAEAHFRRARVLRQLKQDAAAVESYNTILALEPNHVAAAISRGIILKALRRYPEAVASFDAVVGLNPDNAEVWYLRGEALAAMRQFDAALVSYDKAIALKPAFVEAFNDRGVVLSDLHQHDAALASYARAIALKPDYAEAFNNQGVALRDLGRFAEALASFDRAIAVNPQSAEAHHNRGHVLKQLKQFAAAIAAYDTALALNPAYPYLFGARLHLKSQLCDWQNFAAEVDDLARRIERGEKAALPYTVHTLIDDPRLQRKAAAIWANSEHPPNPELGPLAVHPRGAKIRIGYFSEDFRDHAVAQLLIGVLEHHDKAKFEIVAFSLGARTESPIRLRLERVFDSFVELAGKSDRDIAALAREMRIDIAVDLGGFTNNPRTGIFARRAAPIQVNFLGYAGTMAVDYMDYLIADPVVMPGDRRHQYVEKIARLPNCYFPNSYQPGEDKRDGRDVVFTRAQLGLPPEGFVFSCFNANWKLMPATFAGWMRILERVPGSVLWILADSEVAQSNLSLEAERAGCGGRLVFAQRMARAEYLARNRVADLSLDTLPYNAHTSACDALWAGLPVATQIGKAFVGRVAASLLTALDLPELIAPNQAAYEDLAVDLATNPDKLKRIREKLAANHDTQPLFNTQLYTRHIEAAYVAMYERSQAGLPPADFSVAPEALTSRTSTTCR